MTAAPLSDPDVDALIAEFRRAPLGPHSPNLRRLLYRLRAAPAPRKYVLVEIEPYRRWRLARLGERGEPVTLLDATYDSLEAAEWDVFCRRWRALTGAPPSGTGAA